MIYPIWYEEPSEDRCIERVTTLRDCGESVVMVPFGYWLFEDEESMTEWILKQPME